MSNNHEKITPVEPPLDWHANPEGAAVLPKQTDEPELTTMPLTSAIFKLAWPAIGSMLCIMIFNIVDMWWVGKLGANAIAGVSAASFVMWAMQSIALIIDVGVNSLVARFVGAKDNAQASRIVGQGFIMALVMGLGLGLGGASIQKYYFQWMGLDPAVLPFAMDYMWWIHIGFFAIFAAFAGDAAFRGMGDTKTPLKVFSVSLALNIILDPFLIFGIGPFPRMEAAGAALATVITHIIIVVWFIVLLRKRDVHIKLEKTIKNFINFELVWKITKIGAPIAFSGFMFSTSYMALTKVIASFGSAPLAALGIGHRIEGIAYFIAVGFSFAASTLVGQNLGAKKPDRAEKATWLTVLYISVFLVVASFTFYFFGEFIFKFFINDPTVIAEGVKYLKIIAICEIFLGLEIVFEGAFGGAGNSMPPMLVSVPLTWARVPVAILLANTLGLGSIGVWWAISLSTGAKGIVLALWFKRGKWKTHNV